MEKMTKKYTLYHISTGIVYICKKAFLYLKTRSKKNSGLTNVDYKQKQNRKVSGCIFFCVLLSVLIKREIQQQ